MTRSVLLAMLMLSAGLVPCAKAQRESAPPDITSAGAAGPSDAPSKLRRAAGAPGTFNFSARPRGEYIFSADLKDLGGQVSVARAGLDLDMSYQLNDSLGLSLGIEPEVSWYNFSGSSQLIAGQDEPFNDLYRVDITPAFRYGLDEQWTIIGGGLVEFAGEAEADVGESATFGGFIGARYSFSDRFATTFGLLGKSRLEDDAIVLPLIGIEWGITDKLLLSSRGTGLRLDNRINDAWSVWLSGAYESREYRLEDGGLLPEGVVRDRRVPIKVGVDWRPCPSVVLGFEGGVMAWQEFKIDDRNGEDVSEDNTKAAPFIGLNMTIVF